VFGPPWVFEVVTAVVLALVCARFAGSAAVLAFGFFGMLSVALSGIDIAVHRLPDKLTLPAYPVLLLLLGIAAVAGHSGAALLRALLGGVALTCAYFLLAVLRPGQLGAGDVKLAGLTGLALGWLGWPVLILGAALAFVLSAFVSLGLLAARRISLRDSICFGPFMLGGALVAILVSGLPGFLDWQSDDRIVVVPAPFGPRTPSDTLGGRGFTAATRRYRGLSARRRGPWPPSRRRLRGPAGRFPCPRPSGGRFR
jgi:leader peptidase (prepilin peptidase)/N-methyltransferase